MVGGGWVLVVVGVVMVVMVMMVLMVLQAIRLCAQLGNDEVEATPSES